MAECSRRFRSPGWGVPVGFGLLVAGLATPAADAAGMVFLERCVGNCVYQAGPDNSCTNRSSILSGLRTISPFDHGDEAWQQLVACVQGSLAPFDITVTDVDPGCPGPFWEMVVAGSPEEIGQPSNVAGVAPFTCGVIPNAPGFAFANTHIDMLALCWTVTHEFAHLLGADHQLRASDPMTYLTGCLPKRFAAAAAECGDGVPRLCCGGPATQVSSEIVRAAVGDRAGGPIFPGGFEAWSESTQSLEGSTCHWDTVEGLEAFALSGAAGEPSLQCGTATGRR